MIQTIVEMSSCAGANRRSNSNSPSPPRMRAACTKPGTRPPSARSVSAVISPNTAFSPTRLPARSRRPMRFSAMSTPSAAFSPILAALRRRSRFGEGLGWRLQPLGRQLKPKLQDFAERGEFPIAVTFDRQKDADALYLGRTQPLVARVCDAVLGEAFAPEGDDRFARSGAMFTDAVTRWTALVLLRFRYRLQEADGGVRRGDRPRRLRARRRPVRDGWNLMSARRATSPTRPRPRPTFRARSAAATLSARLHDAARFGLVPADPRLARSRTRSGAPAPARATEGTPTQDRSAHAA